MEQPVVRVAAQPLSGARVAFTGKLASMTHPRAREAVRDAGGVPTVEVSRRTSLLVVGMHGWPILPDGTISRRLARAEQLNADGAETEIVCEAAFLERIGRSEPAASTRKTYPPEMISRLVGVKLESLRRWEQLGLIRSVDGHFDYQDLVSLRTIAELVDQGVRPETINKTLRRLQKVLPDMQRPLSQLHFVAQNAGTLLAEFDDIRITPDGQIMFDFAGRSISEEPILRLPGSDADVNELLAYGQACEELERYEEAAEAYRELIAASPRCPEGFHSLANVLRLLGRNEAAEEQYRIAVAQDADLAEAWYNLGDLQEEQGRIDDAIHSFGQALRADPQYADAHFNSAMCLEKCEQFDQADDHWRAYLRLDADSDWADVAKRHLARLDKAIETSPTENPPG